ncbi:MAG: membrane protein insertion efficiency factor YidD [Crocinitomicaceae bacterium]|jgi:putative membrane protein insertion efficiency factor|nr:membrane protein insertion efficiency factor YidD [Crocinitomicaceae bacterium]
MKTLKKILAFPFWLLIKGYQLFISPIWPATCRFEPTCSHYALEAIEKRGVLVGLFLAVKRIGRCHPWGGFGYDPVPDKKSKEK